VAFEVLHRTLMFFGRGASAKCPEIAALSGRRIDLPRIQPVFTRGQLSDHSGGL